jgi:hypothetical protein
VDDHDPGPWRAWRCASLATSSAAVSLNIRDLLPSFCEFAAAARAIASVAERSSARQSAGVSLGVMGLVRSSAAASPRTSGYWSAARRVQMRRALRSLGISARVPVPFV